MASNIDASKPVEGTPTTASVRTNFAAAKSEIEALQAVAPLMEDWTPALVSTGGGAPDYSVRVGWVLRLGRVRIAFYRIALSGMGTLAAGDLSITGLAAATDQNGADNSNAPAVITGVSAAGMAPFSTVLQLNSTPLLLRYTSGTTNAILTKAHLTTLTAITGTIIYRTAA